MPTRVYAVVLGVLVGIYLRGDSIMSRYQRIVDVLLVMVIGGGLGIVIGLWLVS